MDEQPGLGEQGMRWMRGRQLEELTPELRAEVEARRARRFGRAAQLIDRASPSGAKLDAGPKDRVRT